MTTKEASEKWDIIERRINVLCKEGRIPGLSLDTLIMSVFHELFGSLPEVMILLVMF